MPRIRYECLRAANQSDRENIQLLQTQLRDNEADLNLFRRRLGKFLICLFGATQRPLANPSRSGR